jgi:2'-5' RNA ligase
VDRGVVDSVTVFSSDLSGDRPRYEALERVSLGATVD